MDQLRKVKSLERNKLYLMIKRLKNSNLLWGYLAQAFNLGGGLLIIPMVVAYLPTNYVGVWLVFLTMASLAQLLESGFNPTIMRNTAYIYAGAKELKKKGVPNEISIKGRVDLKLLTNLVSFARSIYRRLAVVGAIILIVPGGAYIYGLVSNTNSTGEILISWFIYVIGVTINLYFGYANSLLQGRGDVAFANKVAIVNRGGYVILATVSLIEGFGIIGLSVSMLLSSIAGRVLCLHFLVKDEFAAYSLRNASRKNEKELEGIIWYNALRLGLVQIGAFLIQRASILIASTSLGLEVVAKYGLTVMVLLTLSSVSMTIAQIRMPELARSRASSQSKKVKELFAEITCISWFIYIFGFLFIVFFGSELIENLSGKSVFLDVKYLILFGAIVFLEMNHSVAAMFLSTGNIISFLRPALISGVLVLVLSISSVGSFGVLGLMLSQGIIQLSYNNWKWPREALKELNLNYFNLLFVGMRSIKIMLKI